MLADIVMLVVGVGLTVGTAVFVAAEFSFVALDQAAVAQKAREGDRRAASVLRAMRSLSTQLSGTQVGNTLTTILLGYTTQNACADLLTRASLSAGVARSVSVALGAGVAAVLVNGYSMLCGELIPKGFSLADPFGTAKRVAPFQLAFTALFRPLIAVLNGTANGVLRLVGLRPQEQISSARSASELAALVRHSAERGTLDVSTAKIFTHSIAMARLSAVDVMTDRGRVLALREDASATDVVDLARRTGHSRFPVEGGGADDVVGLVALRAAIAVPYARRSGVRVTDPTLLAPAPRVPETLRLGPLLVQLREEGLQMAIVVDEYGGTSGLVTLEDVVEEIVGDVADEHDRRRVPVRRAPDGSYVVAGTLRPDELAERTGIALPAGGPYDTIGGLVMDLLGAIPREGQRVRCAGRTLRVVEMDGRRVALVRITSGGRARARRGAARGAAS